MPTKIDFRVIECSGAEDGFPPQEIEGASPGTKGWRTQRFCAYPQEFIVQLLPRAVRIRQIQIMSHHYLVTTRAKLEVGASHTVTHSGLRDVRWTALGHVSFSTNRDRNYKLRELKTINVDSVGSYVRVQVFQNHVNQHNLFNQVGMISLNVIGDDVVNMDLASHSAPSLPPLTNRAIGLATYQHSQSVEDVIHSYLPSAARNGTMSRDPALLGSINRLEKLDSITDDLSFRAYQDPKIAKIIKTLEEKKNKAVADEWYEHAKVLKQAIVDLQKFGERLGRLEAEKIRAVEKEDFDTAIRKKAEKSTLEAQALEQLKMHHIVPFDQPPALPRQAIPMDTSPILATTSVMARFKEAGSHSPTERDLHALDFTTPQPMADTTRDFITPKTVGACTSAVFTPLPRIELPHFPAEKFDNRPEVAFSSPPDLLTDPDRAFTRRSLEFKLPPLKKLDPLSHDEQVLPALGKQSRAQQPGENEPASGDEGGPVEKEPPVLSSKFALQHKVFIEVFSDMALRLITSKSHLHRAAGLQEIRERLAKPTLLDSNSSLDVEKAVVLGLSLTLKDRVNVVYHSAVEMFAEAVTVLSSSNADVSCIVQKGLSLLLPRVSDQVKRTQDNILTTVLKLAALANVKRLNIIGPAVTEPLQQKNPPWQLYKGRIDIIHALVDRSGLKHGLSIASIMKFIRPAMEHRSGVVRDAVTDLILKLYPKNVAEVRKHMPPDNEANCKKPFLKHLFTQFDTMDGKPSKKELEAKAKAEEDEKVETIRQLKKEMETLRALQRGEIPLDMGSSAEPSPVKAGPKKAAKVPDPSPQTKKTVGKSPAPPKTKIPKRNPINPAKKLPSPAQPSQDEPAISTVCETLSDGNDQPCMFCEDALNQLTEAEAEGHFCNSCPMLSSCDGCGQVVEVSTLRVHQTLECVRRGDYEECQNCKRAIPISSIAQHRDRNNCPSCPEGKASCPLCSNLILDADESWKHHLKENCTQNPRKDKRVTDGAPPKGPASHASPLSKPPIYNPTVGAGLANIHPNPARSMSKIPTLAARSPRLRP